jgi:CheY-like chemotaxis protein
MRILIIEDEEPKRNSILAVLGDIVPDSEREEARSVQSAIGRLRADPPDLILLDMSLPTFDVRPGETGGRPQGFGGVEVLRYMDRFKLVVPVIVVTAYEAFPKDGRQIELSDLRDQLTKSHPKTFAGLIFYNSFYSGWRDELIQVMKRMGLGQ